MIKLAPATGGMFDFWEKAGLLTPLTFRSFVASLARGVGTRNGNAPGFVWPPSAPSPSAPRIRSLVRILATALSHVGLATRPRPETKPSHGAPGKLQLIAETLLNRARALRDRPMGFSALILGANCSTDALELIGARTPNIALEALSLKHEFELALECEFSGAEYHIDVRARLDEIANDTWHLAQWLDPKQTERAAANAQMRIFSRLVRICAMQRFR